MVVNSRSGNGDVPPKMVAPLRHPRRREVVELLHESSDELSLVALASRLVGERDDSLPDVVVELHDLHLPELIGCGLVEYDDDTGTVTLDADPDVVDAALAHTREES